MPKTREVTNELKTFNGLFNKLTYRHDVSSVFDDFLTIFICVFARETQEPLYFETIKRYKKEELTLFAKMMGELLILYGEAKANNDWIDPLGDYYEILAGQYKKSRLGQYYVAQDLDSICCKMTAINLCMHQIRGEVHHMDTLRMTAPHRSYAINPNFHKHNTLLILIK